VIFGIICVICGKNNMISGIVRTSLILAVLLIFGCSEPQRAQPAANQPATPLAASVKLTVQVAGDEDLAGGVRLLRGEWKARSGGELDVRGVTLDQLLQEKLISADVVIFPSRLLGELVEGGHVRSARSSLLSSPEFSLNDIYPAIRNGEMKYGGTTWALPLGSPPLMMCFQQDTTSTSARALPQTWEQYRTWLGIDGSTQKKAASLGGRAAACALIARALTYTETQRRHEAVFDPGTMKPRITDAPFVRALSEMVEEAAAPHDTSPQDFAGALQQVGSKQAAATYAWPSLVAADGKLTSGAAPADVVFAPLLAAERVYSQSQGRWENQIFRSQVTVLAVEGRLVGVTQSSRNAVSAFQLAQWLSSGDIAIQLSSRSTAALWFRTSQAGSYSRWLKGEPLSKEQQPLSEMVAKQLKIESPLMIPRVPGIDRYLETLGEAAQSAKPGEAAAQAALAGAAEKWEAVTERLGRDHQAAAYRRSLGMEAFEESLPGGSR
jgi:multiple sugar transport system substrate-binding protein